MERPRLCRGNSPFWAPKPLPPSLSAPMASALQHPNRGAGKARFETETGTAMASRAARAKSPGVTPAPGALPDAFDTLAFRHTLAQFATGVAIVSAHNPDGEPVGITVNSFNAVSLSPPLVLFSVQRQAFSLPVLLRAQGYAVNILSE